MHESTEPDAITADWPHIVIVFNPFDIPDITTYPDYATALAALRVRAAYWLEVEAHPVIDDVTTASIADLSALWAGDNPDAWVAIHPLERPLIGDQECTTLLLTWPR